MRSRLESPQEPAGMTGAPTATQPGGHGASVSLVDVSKSLGGQVVLDGLDLTVRPGEFLSILGPSGAGKSTVLNLIAGFLNADSGRIVIGDRDVTDLPASRRDIGFIFQDYALFPHMTVEENVRFPLDVRRVPRREALKRVRELLAEVGLSGLERRSPLSLSGGQRQRVAISRALVFRPPLLLMDEPLSSLDRGLREDMMQQIRSLQRETGVTVVYVTHDQAEALALSDRVAVIGGGRLVQTGTPDVIHSAPISAYVARLVGSINLAPITAARQDAGGALLVDTLGTTLRLPEHSRPVATARDAAGWVLGVRPYAIAITGRPPASADLCAVQGRVREASLTGSGFGYVVDVGAAELWRVVSTTPFPGAEPGGDVWLVWPPQHSVIMVADAAAGAP